jgi:uracil-DNA glycosylase family protein
MASAATKLKRTAKEAASCTRCPLYRNATQTVFGEGPADAAIMMVGEQPGDQEDIAGRPFVGPAGKLLDRALEAAGIHRKKIYLTNAVKHFKNEPRGKKRLHKRPNRYETEVCRVWFEKEISLIRPRLILALGVTAAQSLTGRRTIVLSRERGRVLELPDGLRGMVTTHPSAILRMPGDAARRTAFAALVRDLRAAAKQAT